jgi:FAD/FMN-containing dehydrogenase/Fe-S oxidoreductase
MAHFHTFNRMQEKLNQLAGSLKGELYWDELHKMMYATDASVYRKLPLAVAYPRDEEDILAIVEFANQHHTPLIPRTAGTSLAGQCVGEGLVVDTSRHMTSILHLDTSTDRVTIQPGVIRDELNDFLRPHGLFFGPNTSTSNRCMLGGMVGNNSSGTTSIRYGVTRDKVVALRTVLSDASVVEFHALRQDEFRHKLQQDDLEGEIYRGLKNLLSPPEIREGIRAEFPKASIHRRNTGYAIDLLANSSPFEADGPDLNVCQLLCGSEGTLAFTTAITLQLDRLPPPATRMIAAHYDNLQDCMLDVRSAMEHPLHTCELIDDVILGCTANNSLYDSYRHFVQGNPKAVLLMEIREQGEEEADSAASDLLQTLMQNSRAYHCPVLKGAAIDDAMELRKGGLGLLANMIGDSKAVACIEDTAVALEDLPDFIAAFSAIMESHGQEAVYYAHAGAGELHLRPILNLKLKKDVAFFKEITGQVAELTKRYKGSFSGEHGDGIVRGAYVEYMVGTRNYEILRQVKQLFDPKGILNPGKIVDPWPMDESLRYEAGRQEPEIETFMDFSDSGGLLRLAEKCNGSGDCRKSAVSPGMMCPSYRATQNEKDSTRARANVLREVLTHGREMDRFDSEPLKAAMDLCLSCKACLTECPSTVDIASAKAEFLYQYRKLKGSSLPDKLFGFSTRLNKLASRSPLLTNSVYRSRLFAPLIKWIGGVAPGRPLPLLSKRPFHKIAPTLKPLEQGDRVILFVDEFSQYSDAELAKDAFELLSGLGYSVEMVYGLDSGRALLSKGFLEEAKAEVDINLAKLKEYPAEIPVVGIEPSAILSFRDEYLRLATDKELAKETAKRVLLVEEFVVKEADKGKIDSQRFTDRSKRIKTHVHCHQKALGSTKTTLDFLNLPVNYTATLIPSGCCGMAGSFGYERRHYRTSMAIGEHKLFPAIRKAEAEVTIAANGTSCRHQIADGTGRKALHPISILREALV